MFDLRFNHEEIRYWAGRYDRSSDESVEEAARRHMDRGYLLKHEFIELCRWKTPRSQPLCQENPSELILETTRIALSCKSEEVRIGILQILNGVGWPTASVILHFWHKDPYPILDFRSLWSSGLDEVPSYSFDFWWEYTQFCRRLAQKNNVSMRTLDRALWQFSYENQNQRKR